MCVSEINSPTSKHRLLEAEPAGIPCLQQRTSMRTASKGWRNQIACGQQGSGCNQVHWKSLWWFTVTVLPLGPKPSGSCRHHTGSFQVLSSVGSLTKGGLHTWWCFTPNFLLGNGTVLNVPLSSPSCIKDFSSRPWLYLLSFSSCCW